MKKKLFVLGLIFHFSLQAIPKYASRSFMFTRPATHDLAMHRALWHEIMYDKKGPTFGALQIIPFYESTMEHIDRDHHAAGYFLPHCKSSLSIVGDSVSIDGTPDVRAEWLGLPSTFAGRMRIYPEQHQYGAIIEYQQDLKAFTEIPALQNFWVGVELPIYTVKNNINLRQYDLLSHPNPDIGPTPQDIIQAFNQSDWDFAHIPNCELKKTGFAEVRLKYGAALYTGNYYLVDFYQFFSFPASERQDPKFLFSPFVGNNREFAVGSGVNFQFPLTRKTTWYPILFFFDIEHQFLIRNKQWRTFDLLDKPWSRYLLFNSADGSEVNVPGVNILTRRVKARPDSIVNLSTGFRMEIYGVEAQLNYDLWARGNERLQYLRTECRECGEEIDLRLYGIAGTEPGTSASGSTISKQASNDAVFTPINEAILDIYSAAAGETITNRVTATVGYRLKTSSFDGFINVGGFFEKPQNNAALQLWGAWGKVGVSF